MPRRRLSDATDVLRAAVEGLLVVVAYLTFTRVQDDLGQDTALATMNARKLQALERHLHLAVEAPLNHWAARHDLVAAADAGIYAAVLVLVPLVLATVALLRVDLYPLYRTRLVALSFTSLLVFAALPVAPPRLAQPGIIDVVAAHSPMGAAMKPGATAHADLNAAMPSLHVAWSLWCALALRALCLREHPRWARAVMLLPAVVGLDVLATGNHYFLDVVAGLALTTLASVTVRRGRPIWRPRHRAPGRA